MLYLIRNKSSLIWRAHHYPKVFSTVGSWYTTNISNNVANLLTRILNAAPPVYIIFLRTITNVCVTAYFTLHIVLNVGLKRYHISFLNMCEVHIRIFQAISILQIHLSLFLWLIPTCRIPTSSLTYIPVCFLLLISLSFSYISHIFHPPTSFLLERPSRLQSTVIIWVKRSASERGLQFKEHLIWGEKTRSFIMKMIDIDVQGEEWVILGTI